MSFPTVRLQQLGATNSELATLQTNYTTLLSTAGQASLDSYVAGISNADALQILNGWRQGKPFWNLPLVGNIDPPLQLNAVTGWGHSFMAGTTGAPDSAHSFFGMLGKMLKASSVVNNGVNGALLSYQEGGASAGGVGKILQSFVPQRTAAPRINGQAATGTGIPLHVLCYGINDIDSTTQTEVVRVSLRTSIARLREGQAFESANSVTGVTYGPTGLGTDWSATDTAYTLQNSGAGIRLSSLSGCWVQLTTPADFEGGWVSMRFCCLAVPGTITTTLDGAAYATMTVNGTTDVLPGITNSFTQRVFIPGTGVHTVRCTLTGSFIGSCFFDAAAIEATHPPLIVVMPVLRLPNYGTSSPPAGIGAFPAQPSDARIAAMNAIFRGVCAEFTDGKVICPPIEDTLLGPNLLYAPDLFHPSELGHRVLAAQIYQAVGPVLSAVDLAFLS